MPALSLLIGRVRRVFAAETRTLLHHNHPVFHQRVKLCFEFGQTTLAADTGSDYHLLRNFISVSCGPCAQKQRPRLTH